MSKWDHLLIKIDPPNHQKTNHQKALNLLPEEWQNGAKLDANTHQNPMPKQASKHIMKIIKIPVSLNGKIIKIIENQWL